MPLDTSAIIIALITAVPPTLVALLTLRRMADVKATVDVVKAGVDGMSTEKAKNAAEEATAVERARGQDTAEKVAEAVTAARLEAAVDVAVNGTKKVDGKVEVKVDKP